MADIAKIKRNVIKLRDAGVPDEDIDQYIAEEGTTFDEIKGFRETGEIRNLKKQPKETIGQMLVRNLKGAYAESLAPVVHGASTLGFGIPKAVAERTGTKETIYPEQKTLEGKINRAIFEGIGFAGGGALKLGAKAGLKLLPKVAKEGLKRKMLRSATTFGTAGALQLPEKTLTQPIAETGIQTAAQAGTGAMLGAVGEAIGAGGVKLGRKIKETKAKIKAGKPLEIRTAEIRRKLEEKATPGIEKTKQLQQRLTKGEELLKEKGQQEIEGLKRDIVKVSELETQKAKPEIKELSRRFSKSYGKKLETMPDITRGEANAIITEAENAAKTEGFDTNILSRIRKDYKIEPEQIQESLFGPQVIKEGIDPTEAISFKQFKQSIDRVKREMSAGARGAKLQFTPDDDIVANILFDKFGDYHSLNIPEFAELQTQYKPLLQAIKEAHKTFKPGAMYDLTSGSKFLQDISGTEPKTGPRQIAKILMGGHPEFGEGIPGLGGETKKATELLTGKEKNLEQSLARIKQIKELATNKERMLKEALAKRQETISRQAEKIKTLQYRKKLGIKEGVKRAARRVAVGGAVAAGGYLAGRGQ